MEFLDNLISDDIINSIYNTLDKFEDIRKYSIEEINNRFIKESIRIQELEIIVLNNNIRIQKLEKINLNNNIKIKELEDINLNISLHNRFNECAICLECVINISEQKTLECKHSFHKKCINLVKNHKCPLCNQISNRI